MGSGDENALDLARGPDFQRMTKGTPGDEVGPPCARSLPQARRIVGSGDENAAIFLRITISVGQGTVLGLGMIRLL